MKGSMMEKGSMMDYSMAMDHSVQDGVMMMSGIPSWLFFLGIGFILLVSFMGIERLNHSQKSIKRYWKFNLLRMPFLKVLVKKPYFKFIFQFPVFLIFAFIIYAGIFGHGIINIAPILTWTIWWAGLIFLILFFGKAWCFVCPWDFVATCFQNFKPFGVNNRPFTLGLKWPKALENVFLAMFLFIVLTWFELGYKVTSSPRYTAIMAIAMVFITVMPALIFEKRSFCKHGCLVGRIQGMYSMFAPVEIRADQLSICAKCKTKDCYSGNDKGNACPTSLTLPQLTQSTYCILCTECVRSCPHDNVAINIRPFATDLKRFKTVHLDEGWLALVLLILTSFHGLTMTPLWESKQAVSITSQLQLIFNMGQLGAFTLGMMLFMAGFVFIYYVISLITYYFAKDNSVPFKRVFLYYSYSILPIALFYHLAHNFMHLSMEGQVVIPLLSDPLGNGSNYFGTAMWSLGPLLSSNAVWVVQVFLVLTGHIFGIIIAHYVSRKLYPNERTAMRSLYPTLAGTVFYSFVSLWIMHLDMVMRSSLM